MRGVSDNYESKNVKMYIIFKCYSLDKKYRDFMYKKMLYPPKIIKTIVKT